MMNALIVDDERYAREELAGLLEAFPEVNVVGVAANAQEARERIDELNPDLVFLDIQMPEETGLDLLESLGECAPRIIFTTAYDAYAFRAFEFGVTDYLLKPIAPKRLALALRRLSSAEAAQNEDFERAGGDLPPRVLGLNDKVLISSSDRIRYVPVSSIIGAESLGAYSKLWLKDASPVIRRSLSTLESRLPGELFIRANRAQLINLQHVLAVDPWFSGGLKLSLTGDRTVELSRRQAKLFREMNTL